MVDGMREHPPSIRSVRTSQRQSPKDAQGCRSAGYQRRKPPRRPEIGAYTAVIDQILQDDLNVPRERRHNAKRISLHYLRGADRRQVCLSSHN